MSGPVDEDDYGGQVRIRCDYETYVAFNRLAESYYSYEHALRDLMRVADENPRLVRASDVDLDLPESDKPPTWG